MWRYHVFARKLTWYWCMHVAIDHAFILLFKVGEVADVYQVVNEDEYSDIVRKRQEEDWVIDDGEKLCV